jgi:hypothetical protein
LQVLPAKQGDAEARFEFLDLLADRTGRYAQLFGS